MSELKLIKQTKTPQGEVTSYNKDGTKSTQPLGEIVETTYKCPCGKGIIESTYENLAGYPDRYAFIKCEDCARTYEAHFFRVAWGGEPIVEKKKPI